MYIEEPKTLSMSFNVFNTSSRHTYKRLVFEKRRVGL